MKYSPLHVWQQVRRQVNLFQLGQCKGKLVHGKLDKLNGKLDAADV